MIRKILLPLEDGDDEGPAVALGRSLAERENGELLLLRVAEWPVFGASGGGWIPSWRAGNLTSLRDSLRESGGGRFRVLGTEAVSPALVLDQARREDASLIVLPHRQEGRWARLFHGSVAEQLLADSPIPVWAVPAERASDLAPTRMLFVFGHPEAALQGASTAIEVAQLYGAAVELLRVPPRDPDAFVRESASRDEALLDVFRRRDVEARRIAESGDAEEAVALAVRRHSVDLVVLGALHDQERARRSLARRLVRSLRVPLLLSRTKGRTASEESPASYRIRF